MHSDSGHVERMAHDFRAIPLQAKLEVRPPGDALEEQADRAETTGCACGGSCGACVQRSARPGAVPVVDAPPLVHHVLRSSGQPLDSGTRGVMESRLGHDFSSVRVHTDGQAGRSARELGALAFTTGRDIVFAPGQFAPHTEAGRRLLAHELTHVVQQRGGKPSIQRKTEEKTPCAIHAYDNSDPKDTAVIPDDKSAIGVSSVADLVSKVNAYVDDPKHRCSCVSRLEINGHGTDGYQSVGNGKLYANDDKALVHDSTEEHLKQMAGIKFCARGLLMLLGCHVGQGKGKTLLHRLSALLPGKLIGGAQHYTAGTGMGGKRVAGEGDPGAKGTLPDSKSDPFLKSRFVRWHLTIDGKEYIIPGDDTDTPDGKSKLKAAQKIKVKTPDGEVRVIK